VPPPHAVVFDVGHVLVDWDIRYLYEKLIADPAQLDWFLAHVVTKAWHFEHDAGRDAADTVPELVARYPEHQALIEAYVPRWLETVGRPIAGMFDLVETLHARAVPLFAITNFSHEFWPRFAALHPVTQRFCDVVVSGQEKLMKPDPRIYAIALQRFGLKAGEALFIDDRLDNVQAAMEAGFLGHHFKGVDPLRQSLKVLGLLA
jgi:2-haloacid dehalogenase